jgi:hypothetical protein
VLGLVLPFPFSIYGQTFNNANVSSNGNLQFSTGNPDEIHTCQPSAIFNNSILAYWDDLNTTAAEWCQPNCGIYRLPQGTAPNRTFTIEWRGCVFDGEECIGDIHFAVRLHESQTTFDIIYQQVDTDGANATIGIRGDVSNKFSLLSCNDASLSNQLQVTFEQPQCGATATPTTCSITFADVPPNHTFYNEIRCLACRGIISGYSDGTFRPGNDVTRGQLSKIVSNAAGFSDTPPGQTFEDVPTNHTFYLWIGRMSSRGIISGYPCGGPGEPCVPPANRPYFRPGSNATRGQISKIVSNAAGYDDVPPVRIFEDVPPSHTFYLWVQRLASRGIMGGYGCGGPGEPCVPPDNRPYFRPANNATRGQVSKIVANTFFPGCFTPQR